MRFQITPQTHVSTNLASTAKLCLRKLILTGAMALAAIAIAGCGGGAGAGGNGAGGNDPTIAPPPANGGENPPAGASGFQFKTLTATASSAAFIDQANREGADGFRYRSDQLFGADQQSVYIKDGASTSQHVHKALAPSNDVASLIAQANEQGALGFRFRGNMVFDPSGANETIALYTSDSAVTANYDYEALVPATTASSRETQLNTQGARGYRYISDFLFGGTVSRSLYARDLNSGVSYEYLMLNAPTTAATFLAVVNGQGRDGFRFRSNITQAGSTQISSIFVRLSSGPGRFVYSFLDPANATAIDFLEQSNGQGANRILHQRDLVFGSTTQSLFVDLTNCECMPLRLADPFTD